MILSEQSAEMGREWFNRLQEEVAAAPAEKLEDFRAAIKPDSMGFAGEEGVDDDHS